MTDMQSKPMAFTHLGPPSVDPCPHCRRPLDEVWEYPKGFGPGDPVAAYESADQLRRSRPGSRSAARPSASRPVFGGPDSPDIGEHLRALLARRSPVARLLARLRRIFRRKPPRPDIDWDNGMPYANPASADRDFERLNGG